MNKKVYTDEQIIEIIEKLTKGEGEDEDIKRWMENELYGLNGIFDLIFHSKKSMPSNEILRVAREKNKPIIL